MKMADVNAPFSQDNSNMQVILIGSSNVKFQFKHSVNFSAYGNITEY